MGTCVCIVGMHRSGTSAVTRVLNLLGVYLGGSESMMKPHPADNPTGYWELRKFEILQKRILAGVDIDDVSPEPLPEGWRERASTIEAAAEIVRVVETSFASRSLWGFKDPRTSILLPLWQDLLGAMPLDVRYVIVLRNPLHVAASLGKRRGEIDTRAYQLAWHYYMLSALHHTRGAKRGFVSYHDLMSDWRAALGRAIRRAELPLSVEAGPESDRSIGEFLQPSLERSGGLGTGGWAAPFVAESFDLISKISSEGESKEHDERVQDLLEHYVTVARGALPPFTAKVRRLESDVRTLEATKSENALLQDRLDAIHDSLSWRLTAPLRAAVGILRGGR